MTCQSRPHYSLRHRRSARQRLTVDRVMASLSLFAMRLCTSKTLSKEALAARNDRRLYAWPCPEEPTTDLTKFEHCVSTKVQNRRNSQILFAWREVLVRKFPCGACRSKRSGRVQEDLFVRSCDRCNGFAVVGRICFAVKQNDGGDAAFCRLAA